MSRTFKMSKTERREVAQFMKWRKEQDAREAHAGLMRRIAELNHSK